MNNPELYRKTGVLSKRDASKCLKEFTAAKRWKENNARVIDIGCGDGSTTIEVVRKYVPGSFEKIVGCDISDNMIDYANKHFGGDQIDFLKVDITRELPEYLKGSFDHAFSFYTFNRIKEQEVAFSNTYKVLAAGGNCLLIFLGRYPVYENFRALARTEKWSSYLKDVEVFTSPYHDSKEPETEVRALMQRAGFLDIDVKLQQNSYTYGDAASFKNLVKAINPFEALNEKWEAFMADYFRIVQNPLQTDYQLIVASGSKT